MAFFKKKEPPKEDSLSQLFRLARDGNPEAQWSLEKDVSKAIEYFMESSKYDFVQALYNLGVIYENTEEQFFPTQKPDYKTAFYFQKRGADLGFPASMASLGEFYLNGHGTVQSYKTSKEWLDKAIYYNQGSSRALLNLGKIYAQGLGVSKNLIEAHKLFNLATTIDSHELQKAIDFRKKVELEMTQDEVLAAQELALNFEFLPLPEKFHLNPMI